MKDQASRYDPRVAEIVGFNPNSLERATSLRPTPPITPDKSAPFDVGLEFAKRMRDALSNQGDFFSINQKRLLAVVSQGDTVIRTYHSYIPNEPPHRQKLDPVQTITLKRDRRGIFLVSNIHLVTTNPNRVWSTLDFELGEEHTVIEAASRNDVSRTLRIEYDDDRQSPLILLDGDPTPLDTPWPLLEGASDISLYERSPSSVIVPNKYQRKEVAEHIYIDAGLGISPMNEQDISDMGYHNSRDPLSAALIRWVP